MARARGEGMGEEGERAGAAEGGGGIWEIDNYGGGG